MRHERWIHYNNSQKRRVRSQRNSIPCANDRCCFFLGCLIFCWTKFNLFVRSVDMMHIWLFLSLKHFALTVSCLFEAVFCFAITVWIVCRGAHSPDYLLSDANAFDFSPDDIYFVSQKHCTVSFFCSLIGQHIKFNIWACKCAFFVSLLIIIGIIYALSIFTFDLFLCDERWQRNIRIRMVSDFLSTAFCLMNYLNMNLSMHYNKFAFLFPGERCECMWIE